jgi:uncharacterized protein
MTKISTLAALRSIIGTPNELVQSKIHRELNERAIEFIGKSPMFMLCTADAAGRPTVSPKGDQPGFAMVEDRRTLLIPERKGNKLIFSLTNVLANPSVGLIFLVRGTDETLRVQGRAELLDDPDICQRLSARGAPALLAMRVQVSECYFHCAKAFLRSRLWDPHSWPAKMPISFGCEIAENARMDSAAIEAFDRGVAGRYVTDL